MTSLDGTYNNTEANFRAKFLSIYNSNAKEPLASKLQELKKGGGWRGWILKHPGDSKKAATLR